MIFRLHEIAGYLLQTVALFSIYNKKKVKWYVNYLELSSWKEIDTDLKIDCACYTQSDSTLYGMKVVFFERNLRKILMHFDNIPKRKMFLLLSTDSLRF